MVLLGFKFVLCYLKKNEKEKERKKEKYIYIYVLHICIGSLNQWGVSRPCKFKVRERAKKLKSRVVFL